ncbi:hypothetical protein [Sphingomonas sp. Y38-1Y]|jgi:hypothetical protein|nr:hypothetical protein [Sphingomonas sp. Y38-1Y]
MQGTQPFKNLSSLGKHDTGVLSNLTVYSAIAVFLLAFWLTVALIVF